LTQKKPAKKRTPKRAPKVSVILRTKDRPLLLERALKGLAAQSFDDYELVIVNDGGTPPNLAGGPQITIINNPNSLGRSGAADKGLKAAKGDYVLFHDDDDTLLPEALAILSETLDAAPEAIGAICGYEIITEAGEAGDFKETEPRRSHIPDLPPTLTDLAFANSLLTISTLFKRKAAIQAGGITLGLDALEDWDLWLRLMLEGDFALTKQVLARQHIREASDGAYNQSAKDEHDAARIRLLNHYLREDIKSGKQGLGHLMNVQNRQTIEDLNYITGTLKKIKKAFTPWK